MNPSDASERSVVCLGEALWDVFPRYSRPGGAPLNVAVQTRRLGRRALPVSAVGRDAAGDRLLALISQERLPIRGIARHATLPTGRVDVTLAGNDVEYAIRTPAAWDEIAILPAVAEESRDAVALVFGTLAQRSDANRASLDTLLSLVPDDALCVFDVNLRAPFIDIERIWQLARCADLIKVNREELEHLVGGEDVEAMARALAERLDRTMVCVTMGSEGAALLRDGEWLAIEASPVEPVDPVGAGDAFVAALVDSMLRHEPPHEALRKASMLAASVAARSGAW